MSIGSAIGSGAASGVAGGLTKGLGTTVGSLAAIPNLLIGAALGGGPKPLSVPGLPPLDIAEEQKRAVEGNISALPAAQQLASRVNQFSQAELQRMLDMAFPGASAQVGKNIGSLLRGEVPEDVGRAVQRSAASRALAGGFSGSGLGGNLLARDLGLTSLNLQQQGASQLQALAPVMTAPRFSVASMFMTPSERMGLVLQDRAERFERDLLAARAAQASKGGFDAIGDFFLGSAFTAAGAGAAGGAAGSAGGGFGNVAAPPPARSFYQPTSQPQPVLSAQQASNSMSGLRGLF